MPETDDLVTTWPGLVFLGIVVAILIATLVSGIRHRTLIATWRGGIRELRGALIAALLLLLGLWVLVFVFRLIV